jgi:hypothetical protein
VQAFIKTHRVPEGDTVMFCRCPRRGWLIIEGERWQGPFKETEFKVLFVYHPKLEFDWPVAAPKKEVADAQKEIEIREVSLIVLCLSHLTNDGVG